MTNSETKNFSQNVSSSYHLEDRGKCNKNTCANARNVPKLRFKGYNYEWKHYRLKDITTRITRKNKKFESDRPLTISAIDGLIDQKDYFNRQIASKDMSGYYLLKNGEFAYNKSYSNGFPYGSIKRLNKYDKGALSTLYICFSLQNICSDFLEKYFETDKWYKEIYMIAVEGARNHGLLNISVEDFFNTMHKFPNIEEQEKIASFLTLIDKKIEKQKELVELLKKYKRGLLSAIFSQKLRFKDDNGNDYPAWEEKSLNNIFDTVTDFVAAGSFADLRKNVQYNEKPDFAQLVRTIDLKNNFKNKDFVFVNELAFKYLWRVNLSEDALILPNIGANIGEVYYINSFKLPYKHNVLGPNAILLKSSNNNLYYLYSKCLTDNFRKLLFLQVGASGQPKFNKTDLKKIKIKISINIDEQNKISDFLSKFDDKIQQEESTLNYLQMYKKGLLQQLFI